MSSFKLKIKSTVWLLLGHSLELVIIKYLQALILNKSSALHERMLISHVHSFEIMEWHNLSITTLETVIYAQNVFLKSSENQIVTNFIDLTSLHFVTIYRINYWDQVNSWKNLWKLWNDPLAKINQTTPLYSMLQHIGRVTIPMLAPRNYLIYLQTTVRTWGEVLVSESIRGIV